MSVAEFLERFRSELREQQNPRVTPSRGSEDAAESPREGTENQADTSAKRFPFFTSRNKRQHFAKAPNAPTPGKRFKGVQKHVCNNDKMHCRSRHFQRELNFFHLAEAFPYLAPHVFVNKFGTASYRFGDPAALILFTRALLKLCYGIEWSLPTGYLCPTVPSRANYVHYVADLLAADRHRVALDAPEGQLRAADADAVPRGPAIHGLDIGVGANGIYALLGAVEYGWAMTGTDIEEASLAIAQTTIDANKLGSLITLRCQTDPERVFQGVVQPDDRFAFSICNPPFHSNVQGIQQNAARVLEAQEKELVCDGGELGFIKRMITESQKVRHQIMWFTSLVARAGSLKPLIASLRDAQVSEHVVLELYQGKQTRWVIAWTFLTPEQRSETLRSNLRTPHKVGALVSGNEQVEA